MDALAGDMDICSRYPEPAPAEVVVEGQHLYFDWGREHELGTCAYWIGQTRRQPPSADYRLGETLAEEVAACILGGHGVPADVGLAAFRVLRDRGLLREPDSNALSAALSSPISVPGRERPTRYRFARQRGERIAGSLRALERSQVPDDPIRLREFLVSLPGIGPKTGSWIVRNWTGSDRVAIIDIHIQRAGMAAGFFCPEWRVARDYYRFETAFCEVARMGGVSTAALDACIWYQMQALGRAQAVMLGVRAENSRL
jgi:N-glycosylase/DNA lyase